MRDVNIFTRTDCFKLYDAERGRVPFWHPLATRLQLSAFAKYIVPPPSVTSTGDFAVGGEVVCCSPLTGRNAVCFRECVSVVRSAALGKQRDFIVGSQSGGPGQ